ncbi:ParB/RepB/Spo0J family partition protein [Rhodoferax sp.]|uniref:ParB/RepB/Spo0J family partition protein n=1 Tax=Rhodoferax sp. TaxID=50421 RepID=UPI002764C0F0|nr:ParB/RepB/Spo0J family partition protein [Rhodoferax sp.]
MAKHEHPSHAPTREAHEVGDSATILGKSESVYIRLSKLFLSDDNARKEQPTQRGIEELASMIEAQGQLSALQVTQEVTEGQATGRHAVEAGGRRLRALQFLASKGRIEADPLVECKLIAKQRAKEVSLTENISQESMHPADEFDAYRVMADEGQTTAAIARKFGVPELHVLRRLRLANVAPKLLELFRAGDVSLEQIMALASVDDHERQLQVWDGLPSHNRHANAIKRKLSEEEIPETDCRVKVVGLKNYLEAGGIIRADLFSEQQTKYLSDPGLVEMMLGECLEARADTVRAEGWAWVDICPVYDYDERQKYVSKPKSYEPETPAIEVERLALEAQIQALREKYEAAEDAADWDKSEELADQIDVIEASIEALKQSRVSVAEVDKSSAGAVVALGHGGLEIHRWLVRRSELKKGNTNQTSGAFDTPQAKRPEVPESLMRNLSSHRTAAMQASMLTNQRVSLAVLADRMARAVLENGYHASPIKISLTESRSKLQQNAPTLAVSRAALTLDAACQAWQERLPQDSGTWFAWLLEQPQETVLSLIVFAAANCVDAVVARTGNGSEAAPLAAALSLDMADWWQATPEAYLDLVPKCKLIEAVTEIVGAQVASGMNKMKKAEAVNFAAQHVTSSRWVPAPLRRTDNAAAPCGDHAE